ncbi:MAG: type II secretion system F family protein [Acidobacteriota bacterium]
MRLDRTHFISELLGELARAAESPDGLLDELETSAEDHPERALRSALSTLVASLREGQPLSEALQPWHHELRPERLALIATAERSGRLVETLSALERDALRRERERNELLESWIGPLASLGVGLIVLALLGTHYAPVLRSLGGSDTPTSVHLLGTLGAPALLLTLLVVIVLAFLAVRRWLGRSDTAAHWLDRLPLIGSLRRTRLESLAARALSESLLAEAPLPEALDLAAGALRGPARSSLQALAAAARDGASITDLALASSSFSPIFRATLAACAESGQLPEALARLADSAEAEADLVGLRVSRTLGVVGATTAGLLAGSIALLGWVAHYSSASLHY